MIRTAYLVGGAWWRQVWWVVGLGLIMVTSVAWLLVEEGNARLAIAVSLLTLLGGLALISPRGVIVGTLVFLTMLGDVRRALIPLAGWADQDPLMLVGPTVAVSLVVLAAVGKRFRLDTPLSRWVAVLMVLMLLHAANPTQQGGLTLGMAGALFYVVPLLWFWIGRSYADEGFLKLLLFGVVVPLAVLASLLGLYQAFYGLLPFEQAWVNVAGYDALDVEGQVRPISFFTSAAEYAHYLAVGVAVLWAGWLRKAHIGLALAPLLVVALFLASSRGMIVMLVFALALLWAVRARGGIVRGLRLLLALAVGVVMLYLILLQLQHFEFNERIDGLVDHQVKGLLNPFDAEQSTAGMHLVMFGSSFSTAAAEPLGQGLGATTIAGDKFGGSSGPLGSAPLGSTEVDLSNMLVSLGVAGGAVYAVIIVLVLMSAFRYWRRSGGAVALAVIGILIVELGQWLTGGHYAVSALIWLCIGALDGIESGRKSA